MTHLHRQLGTLAAISALFAISAVLSSCNKQPPPPAPPPPPVTIAKPVQKDIVEWDVYTGRTDAVESVNITPRVSGYIDNITFKAGDLVNKGDLLFVIDPRPYQATLDQVSAQLRQAEQRIQLLIGVDGDDQPQTQSFEHLASAEEKRHGKRKRARSDAADELPL